MTPPAAASPAVRQGRATSPQRRHVAPPRPRRVSGPVRPSVRPPARPVTRPPAARSQRLAGQTAGGRAAQAEQRGLALGLLAIGRSLSSHRALDRLIRGRIWIGLIAFALIGIVTLQLIVLQLNASIGRSLVREASLQRENAALSIEGSELAGGELVESQAGRLGMGLVPLDTLRFLRADPRADVQRAAAALRIPVPSAEQTPGSG